MKIINAKSVDIDQFKPDGDCIVTRTGWFKWFGSMVDRRTGKAHGMHGSLRSIRKWAQANTDAGF